jgi:hypothetical protein
LSREDEEGEGRKEGRKEEGGFVNVSEKSVRGEKKCGPQTTEKKEVS